MRGLSNNHPTSARRSSCCRSLPSHRRCCPPLLCSDHRCRSCDHRKRRGRKPSLGFAVLVEPTRDDLPVEIGAVGISDGAHEEGRRFAVACGFQISTHRNAVCVAVFGEVGAVEIRLSKSNPAKTRTLRRVPREFLGSIAYGIACMVWQILVLAVVCVVAIAILHGIGILGRGHTRRRADASGQSVSHFARFFPRGESAVGLVEAGRCSRACDDRAICPFFLFRLPRRGWLAFPNWIACG